MPGSSFKRTVPQSRAREFQEWILAEISKLPPDSCLPPDRELGAQWDLSTITIQRVLAKLRDEGKVIRIPGKGTFTPNLEKSSVKRVMRVRTDTSWESSVDHLASNLIRMISEGVYRKGKALPPVKFIRNQFRVSSETVTSAYQSMESQGYVEKIGKNYWVGRMDQLLSDAPRREVTCFRFGTGDFQQVFTGDPLSLAFQKMERELYHSGFSLRFESIQRLDALATEWETSGRYPSCLFFYGVDASHIPFFRDLYGRYPGLKKNQVRLAIYGQGNDLSELASMGQVFSRGNTETERARALAHHLLNRGVREACLCLQESDITEIPRAEFALKIALSLKNAIPGFKLHIVVNAGANSATGADRLLDTVSPEFRKYLEAKFPGSDLAGLDREVRFSAQPFEACRENAQAKVWIFSRDKAAGQALTWMKERGIRVPEEVSLVGLENDPACYNLGISHCGPDWDGLGYALAHSIVGDVRLARSQNGFVKVRGRFVDKLTTAA